MLGRAVRGGEAARGARIGDGGGSRGSRTGQAGVGGASREGPAPAYPARAPQAQPAADGTCLYASGATSAVPGFCRGVPRGGGSVEVGGLLSSLPALLLPAACRAGSRRSSSLTPSRHPLRGASLELFDTLSACAGTPAPEFFDTSRGARWRPSSRPPRMRPWAPWFPPLDQTMPGAARATGWPKWRRSTRPSSARTPQVRRHKDGRAGRNGSYGLILSH